MTREDSRHAGRGSGTGASAGATEGAPTQGSGAQSPPGEALPAERVLGDTPSAERVLGERLLDALQDARHRTLFATELAAIARAAGGDTDRFERALAALERQGRILVLGRHPPDVHLVGTDLRTVHACGEPALDPERPGPERQDPMRQDPARQGEGATDPTESARRRGEEHWAEFLRTFLATRRCC